MGLNVEVAIKYNGHTFSRIPDALVDRIVLRGVGFTSPLNDVTGSYIDDMAGSGQPTEYFYLQSNSISNINYEDVTKALIHVELAGGLCNRTLGDALIHLKRDQCPNFDRAILIQTFQTPLYVPAHQIVIEFGSLQTDNVNFALEVKRYLHAIHNDTALLDLRNVTSNESLSGSARFEYHPAPTLRTQVCCALVV